MSYLKQVFGLQPVAEADQDQLHSARMAFAGQRDCIDHKTGATYVCPIAIHM
jgi:hypothetical protein